MAEAITTTAQAPDNPTTPGPLATAAPAPQPVTPRAGSITAAEYGALPPADQDKYAAVRRPGGGQDWIARDQLAKEPPTADGNTAPPADGKYRYGQYEFSETEIADLMKFKGETELRRAAVPADPSQYKIELPADVVMPPGVTWQFNEADPALEVARKWSHANGLDQAQFSSLLGQYVSMEAAKEAAYTTALKREVEALGANATMRITALETWLRGVVGEDLAKAVRSGLISHKQVLALEKLATRFTSQGAASFSQSGREVQQNGKGPLNSMSEEQYAATSAQERYRLSRT